MEIIYVFAVLSVIIFLGFFSELFFRKTKIPDVLILIIIGIIIGSVLKWSSADDFGFSSELFTTFALIFILFQGALNLDFRTIIRTLPQTLALTSLSFILTVSVTTIVAIILGYDLMISLLVGTILAGTSSAVVIPLVNNVEIREKYSSILTIESAVSDVLCIVGTITILEIIKTGQIVASHIFKTVLSSFSLALVVGVIVGIIWVTLMYHYESLTHTYLLSIAVVMALYAFVESSFVSASGAIAALAFGIVMGNSRGIHEYFRKGRVRASNDEVKNILLPSTKSFYTEISFFIKTFFFVYLGILIDFTNLDVLLYGILISILIFFVRPIAVKLTFSKDELENKERTYLETIIPKGLAAAVLAGIAIQSGVIDDSLGVFSNIILSTVFFSILMTSVIIFLTEKNMFKSFQPWLIPKHKK